MIGVPATTEFDLKFRVFGIPARITPFFWIATAFLGSNLGSGTSFVLWVLAVTLSILVHEYGHGLTAKFFGQDPSVILYEFGGLCVYPPSSERPRHRFLVLLMGPGAGFILGGLVFGWFYLTGRGILGSELLMRMPRGVTSALIEFLSYLLYINIWWGVVNLLPVFPLDGGQMTMIVLQHFDPRHGQRKSLTLSLVAAGLVAIYMARREDYMPALLFGFLAFRSYQLLQNLHYQLKYGDNFESEEDWWKR